MASYREIAPTEDAVEAFVTAELADAWTNNPLAIAEGDAAAHAAGRAIRAAAMRGVAAGSEVSKTILGVFPANLNRTNAGAGNFNIPTGPFGPSLTALRAGTVTVSAQLRHTVTGSGATGGMTLNVYVNGSIALTLTSTGSSYATITGNLTFAAGDVIDFSMATTGTTASGGGTITADARQVKCLSDIASFWCI